VTTGQSSTSPLASCRDVSRTYGSGPASVVAVHGTNCDIYPSSRIAVVGSSGCGKSTLLHLLAGLESPTTGTVTWPWFGTTPRSRPDLVGMIFQGPSLVPALNVIENVTLPLVLAGTDEAEAREQAQSCLTRLDIGTLATRLPEDLSGGQSQRVAIARALAARARLILADEPTGQLDHATAAHVIDVLIAAADELGAALVVSTHDPVVAARMDHEWPMQSGRLRSEPGLA
jgi:putative ABC transport system ATP-binding protein